MITNQQIIDIFNWRHACKEFDPTRKISRENMQTLIEAMSLSPTSFGLQPFKVLILKNQEIRNQLTPHCWGAQKQLPTSSDF